MHVATSRNAAFFELLEVKVEVLEGMGADLLSGLAERLPVGHFADNARSFSLDHAGRVANIVAQLCVLQQRQRGGRKVRRAAILEVVRGHMDIIGGHSIATRESLSLARIVAMCSVRMLARWRCSAPPICIRQELSQAVHTSRLRLLDVLQVFLQHRSRNIGDS